VPHVGFGLLSSKHAETASDRTLVKKLLMKKGLPLWDLLNKIVVIHRLVADKAKAQQIHAPDRLMIFLLCFTLLAADDACR